MKISKYNVFIENDNNSFLLLNTLTGNTYMIDSSVKENLEKGNFDFLEKEKLLEYKKYKIIIDDNIEEWRYYSHIHNLHKFNSETISLTILLTMNCNLGCIYCFQGSGETKNCITSELARDNIYKFIEKMAHNKKYKNLNIVLFGGEPLLNFDKNVPWLNDIKNLCVENDLNLTTSIVTNGTLITNEILDSLKEYNCKSIQVTLDGLKEIHDKRRIYKNGKGSFDDVIRGIKLIKDKNNFANPTIRINIDKNNIKLTEELLNLLCDEGLNSCFVDFGIVKGGTEACASYAGNCFVDGEISLILEKLWKLLVSKGFPHNRLPIFKPFYCGLYSNSSYTIAPNGELYKCWEHVGIEEHRIGRINEQGIHTDVTYAYYDWMSRNPTENTKCRECNYLPVCGGGCGAIGYEKYATYHSPGCFKTKGVLELEAKNRFKQVSKN
jgi:uncharacterized protein